MDIVKICKKHGCLTLDNVYKNKNYKKHGKKYYFKCKYCHLLRCEKYRSLNNKKIIILRKKYYLKNKERIIKKSSWWEKTNREKRRIKKRIWSANNRIKINGYSRKQGYCLTDNYIKGLLTNKTKLTNKDIPTKLIEIKRLEIKLKRKLKELKNVNK